MPPIAPPAHGPLATAVWNDAAESWHLRLTEAGRRLVEDFLRRWPNPATLIRPYHKGVWTKLCHFYSLEEMRQVGYRGVCYAALRFDPAIRTDLTPLVRYHVLEQVQKMLREDLKPPPTAVAREEAVNDPEYGPSLVEERLAVVQARRRLLSRRQNEILDAYLAAGASQKRAAVLLGLTPQAVGDSFRRIRDRLREAVGTHHALV